MGFVHVTWPLQEILKELSHPDCLPLGASYMGLKSLNNMYSCFFSYIMVHLYMCIYLCISMFFGGADRVCDFQFFFMQRFHDRSMMMNAYNYSNHLNLINKYIYIYNIFKKYIYVFIYA